VYECVTGSQEIANDLRGLRHYNVTHVLNVTVEVPDRFPDQFIYKRIAISDMPSAKLVPHFDEAFRFIDAARSARGSGCVLVHCYYGNSRSASVVIGYLMVAERMRYVDALRYLQLLRPGVRPNDGFQRQLEHYESSTVKRLRQQSAAAAAAAAAASGDGSVASGNR
jgi:protein-tyrosine phosphatase